MRPFLAAPPMVAKDQLVPLKVADCALLSAIAQQNVLLAHETERRLPCWGLVLLLHVVPLYRIMVPGLVAGPAALSPTATQKLLDTQETLFKSRAVGDVAETQLVPFH